MATDLNDGATDASDRKLPRKVQEIVSSAEDGTITGITADDFVEVFQAISGSVAAVKQIADMAAQSQKDAHANIKDAIAGKSESLDHIAQRLETDEARLEFTRLYLKREREKTKQAKIAEKVNDSNNKFFGTLATVVGAVLLGGIKLLADRRSA